MDISFKVTAGQTVAIVGQTGSGKTTLVKLVNRTYDVSAGSGAGGRGRRARLEPGGACAAISRSSSRISSYSRGLDCREHRLWQARRLPRKRSKKAARAAQADEFITIFQGWLPNGDRRARCDPLRRAAPAPGAGARFPDRSAHPDPG